MNEMETRTNEEARLKADIILSQLGGNKFLAMTGSKNLGYGWDKSGNPYLSMSLARNRSKAQYLRITLNGSDLYDLVFMRFTGERLVTVAEKTDIYCDMLQMVFKGVTGLDTHL